MVCLLMMLMSQQQIAFAKPIALGLSAQQQKPQQNQIAVVSQNAIKFDSFNIIQSMNSTLHNKSQKNSVHDIDGQSKDAKIGFRSDLILRENVKLKIDAISDGFKPNKLNNKAKMTRKMSKWKKMKRDVDYVYDGPPPIHQSQQSDHWPPNFALLNTSRGPHLLGTIPINIQSNQ